MSTLKVDSITNNGSAVDLTNGAFQIGGNDVVQGYTESASEPSSPTKGDIWWDTGNNKLYQYLNGEFKEITTVSPWSVQLGNVSYDSVSFSVGSQESNITGFAFNSDGTKMYVIGTTADAVYQYSLSTGFDLSTASYDSVSFSFSSQENNAHGISLSADGSKMYISGTQNPTIYQYGLSTAFDLSTASYDSVSFSVSSQETGPLGLCFNDVGTKLYVVGYINDTVYQYTLSTAFDLATASYDSVSLNVSSQATEPHGVAFDQLGTKMYIVCNGTNSVYEYNLSTGFDLSTGSYASSSLSVSSQDSTPTEVKFSADGTKMYIGGDSSNNIFQYSTGL